MERMLKNRLSAKRSREIAKKHVNLLEKNVAFLSRQAQLLAQRLAIVEAENARLRQHAHMNQSAVTLGCMHNHTKTASFHEPAALLSLQWIPLLLFLSTADRPSSEHSSTLTASNLRPETGMVLDWAVLRRLRTDRSAPPQWSFCKTRTRSRRLLSTWSRWPTSAKTKLLMRQALAQNLARPTRHAGLRRICLTALRSLASWTMR